MPQVDLRRRDGARRRRIMSADLKLLLFGRNYQVISILRLWRLSGHLKSCSIRLCLKTRSGFERLIFRLAVPMCIGSSIDDTANQNWKG